MAWQPCHYAISLSIVRNVMVGTKSNLWQKFCNPMPMSRDVHKEASHGCRFLCRLTEPKWNGADAILLNLSLVPNGTFGMSWNLMPKSPNLPKNPWHVFDLVCQLMSHNWQKQQEISLYSITIKVFLGCIISQMLID